MADSSGTTDQTQKKVGNFKFIVRALRARNYRLFFTGNLISLIGSWLTTVASANLVFNLTQSAAWLGAVVFAGQIPMFLLAPFAGVWADRWPRHRILVVTQTLSMLESFALGFLALTHRINVLEIMWLNAFQGMVNAFDVPTRQAFIVEMVDNRDDLGNAIALNSSMFHGARIIGPAIASVIIARFSEGVCFTLDGFSYLAVILSLLMMILSPRPHQPARRKVLHELREAAAYTFGFAPIRTLMISIAIASFCAMPQTALMPSFNALFRGNERTLGWLYSSAGAGAFMGSIYLASRRSVVGLGRVIAVGNVLLGIGLLGFGFANSMVTAVPLLVLSGAAMLIQMASSNTVLQTIVDDDKRGRVMSLYTMAFMGAAPLGSLLGGLIAAHVGPSLTLRLSGGVCLLGSAFFLYQLPRIRPLIRPIYVRKGIIQVAQGLTQVETLASSPAE